MLAKAWASVELKPAVLAAPRTVMAVATVTRRVEKESIVLDEGMKDFSEAQVNEKKRCFPFHL